MESKINFKEIKKVNITSICYSDDDMKNKIKELLVNKGIDGDLIRIKKVNAGTIVKEGLSPLKNDIVCIEFRVPESISIMDVDDTHCCGRWECEGKYFVISIMDKLRENISELSKSRSHGMMHSFYKNNREVNVNFEL